MADTSPLDFVDVDPNYHVLKECFPDLSSDAILDAIEDADGDLNKASEILMTGLGHDYDGYEGKTEEQEEEEEDDEKFYTESPDYKVLSLAEMFPHIDVEVISTTLKDTNYDTVKASESLLNHGLIVDFEKELQIEEATKIQNSNRTWGQIHERIYEIAELVEVDINIAKSYYHKNGGNIIQALVDIIYNLKIEQEKERLREQTQKEKGTKQLNRVIPKGGRVQNGLSKRTPTYNTKPKKQTTEKPAYTYDENSPEVSELATLIYDDPHLVNINWEFNQKALVYFEGDVTKVMALDLFIVEFDGVRLTYREEPEALQGNMNTSLTQTSQPPARFLQVLKKPINVTVKQPSMEDDLTAKQIALQRVQLKKCKENSQLDLHGFHIKNARDTTRRALKDWWDDELRAREASGRAGPGKKAREIGPFVVITGKGLHSEGGFSKVRATIKKYLNNSEYYALEEDARFVVIGLKR